MGASNRKIEHLRESLEIKENQWQKIDSFGLTDFMQYVGTSSAIPSRLQTQTNIIKLVHHKQQLEQLQIYQYRKESDDSLLKCYGAQPITHNGSHKLLCGSEKIYKVLTQRFVKLLPTFPELSVPETAYALKQALEGYQILYKKLGEFQIRENMMGINSIGQFKVWCNGNGAKNCPQTQLNILKQQEVKNPTKNSKKSPNPIELFESNSQSAMVSKILSLIEIKCTSFSKFPPQLEKRLKITSNNRYTYDFSTIIREVEEFIKEYHITIPNKLQRLLKSAQNQHEMGNGIFENIIRNGSKGKNQIQSIVSTGYFKQLDNAAQRNNTTNSSNTIHAHNPHFSQPSNMYDKNNFGSYAKVGSKNQSNSCYAASNDRDSLNLPQNSIDINLPNLGQKYFNRDSFISNVVNNQNTFNNRISMGYVNSFTIRPSVDRISQLQNKNYQIPILNPSTIGSNISSFENRNNNGNRVFGNGDNGRNANYNRYSSTSQDNKFMGVNSMDKIQTKTIITFTNSSNPNHIPNNNNNYNFHPNNQHPSINFLPNTIPISLVSPRHKTIPKSNSITAIHNPINNNKRNQIYFDNSNKIISNTQEDGDKNNGNFNQYNLI